MSPLFHNLYTANTCRITEPRTMDCLSEAASVIAVIDISLKITSLCYQYSVAVKDTKKYIERLKGKVNDFESILRTAKQLLEDLDKAQLATIYELSHVTQAEGPSSVLRLHTVADSQSRTVWSFDADATSWPSGGKATDLTVAEWPSSVPRRGFVVAHLRATQKRSGR